MPDVTVVLSAPSGRPRAAGRTSGGHDRGGDRRPPSTPAPTSPPVGRPVRCDGDSGGDSCTYLHQLFHEPGRHFGGVGVDDVAAKVVFDASAGDGDEVGGGEELLGFEVVDVAGRGWCRP